MKKFTTLLALLAVAITLFALGTILYLMRELNAQRTKVAQVEAQAAQMQRQIAQLQAAAAQKLQSPTSTTSSLPQVPPPQPPSQEHPVVRFGFPKQTRNLSPSMTYRQPPQPPCPNCGGAKRVRCDWCGGSGWMKCRGPAGFTSGEFGVTCVNGIVRCNMHLGADCPFCDNQNGKRCSICGGRGVVQCVLCGGKGWKNCPICGGVR